MQVAFNLYFLILSEEEEKSWNISKMIRKEENDIKIFNCKENG